MITKKEIMTRICILEGDSDFIYTELQDLNRRLKKLEKVEKPVKKTTKKVKKDGK